MRVSDGRIECRQCCCRIARQQGLRHANQCRHVLGSHAAFAAFPWVERTPAQDVDRFIVSASIVQQSHVFDGQVVALVDQRADPSQCLQAGSRRIATYTRQLIGFVAQPCVARIVRQRMCIGSRGGALVTVVVGVGES